MNKKQPNYIFSWSIIFHNFQIIRIIFIIWCLFRNKRNTNTIFVSKLCTVKVFSYIPSTVIIYSQLWSLWLLWGFVWQSEPLLPHSLSGHKPAAAPAHTNAPSPAHTFAQTHKSKLPYIKNSILDCCCLIRTHTHTHLPVQQCWSRGLDAAWEPASERNAESGCF